MPQTNIAAYLSIINWLIIIFSLYYIYNKSYILRIIRTKLYIKTSKIPTKRLRCFRPYPNFPIFI